MLSVKVINHGKSWGSRQARYRPIRSTTDLKLEHSSVTCVTGRAKKKKFCSIILIYNGKDFEFYHYITSKDLKFNKNHKIKIFLKEES